MTKIYCKGVFIAETNGEDVNEVIDHLIATAKAEIQPMLNQIKELGDTIENVYPKRRKDTEEEYLAFLRNVNPEFIEALETLGKSVFGNRFTGLYIIAPNTVGTLLEFQTDGNYIDKISIASLRERLKSRVPNRRFMEIIEE